ncbi:hypothetical protein CspHIS471_0302290 [Cutaneotrichosporon sp. HIS471]|nr:hypothetical protein CspHIS471_0302290 [Cutaneotrichosporon sp. HIS471]
MASGNGLQGRPKAQPDRRPRERTPWLLLLPVVLLFPYLFSKLHYTLPVPQPPLDAEGRPQPSEEIVLAHIQALEDIGYRTVGTDEAVNGEEYVIAEVRKIEERCKANGVLNCDVWVQRGSGYHEFSIMGHDVLKVYAGIRNVVLQIRAKNPITPRTVKKDAILVGSHIDSTLPSPGAADDGMGVGVMLDVARILVDRNEPFDNSVIFMWNGAEETLQDGSHLYSTQHPTAADVRAMFNLEAAGTTGGALLFQATSQEMIDAFSRTPYPRGTVIAADVFSSGIILSDTDFGQFEEYLNVSGLDMAVVGHSYFYHTRKDSVPFIEIGTSQHFTSNAMAIVDYLLSPGSPLGTADEWSPPDVVYMSLYDRIFVSWTMENADKAYLVITAIIAAITLPNLSRERVPAFAIALIGAPLGLVGGLLTANVVAFIMASCDKAMGWFSHEGLPVALYGPAALLGYLATQHALAALISPARRIFLEPAHYYSQLVWLAVWMLVLQAFRVRSAYLFAGIACSTLVGAFSIEARQLLSGGRNRALPFVTAYVVPLTLLVALSMEAYTTTLDIFVPLTGRMGKDAPVEHIIAIITSVCTLVFFPLVAPLFSRISRATQRKVLVVLLVATVAVGALFMSPLWSPYDFMHPKRLGVQYTYNHTSGLETAHIAFMDSGRNAAYMKEVYDQFGNGAELVRTEQGNGNSDWDVLYPVSSFLETYSFELPKTEFDWPEMTFKATREKTDEGHTRIHLKTDHKGLVWPALAFEADLVDWSFDFVPPHGHKRHHIKAASSVDEHGMELELTMRLKDDEPFRLHWSAMDLNQMVPGTAPRLGPDMPASKWLTALDDWGREHYSGGVDICMNGVVVGVLTVEA